MRISVGRNIVIVIMSLHPCRRIVEEDIGSSAISHADRHVAGLSHENLLVIQRCADAATVSDFRSVSHRKSRRSHGDTLQFTEEITGMRGLIIAAHLPYHGIAVLHVVPKRVVTPFRGNCCRIDANSIIRGTRYDFLTPVAQDVALITRCRLGVIVAKTARQGLNSTISHLIYAHR